MADRSSPDPQRVVDSTGALVLARAALQHESACLEAAAGRLGDAFVETLAAFDRCPGRPILAGQGKSGWIAGKLATTLCSIGIPSHFLNAAEAVHGDLGMIEPGCLVLLISKSGSTQELVRLVPLLRERGCFLVGLLGQVESPLGRSVDLVLDASISRESDPLALVPTASSTVALSVGHALIVALMARRGFTPEAYARIHPGGQIGRNILRTVSEVMHRNDAVAWVGEGATLREVVMAMTRFPLGAACVVAGDHELLGVVTDGDIRRVLERDGDILKLTAGEVMCRTPVTVSPDAILGDALRLMEDRPRQLSVLPVLEKGTPHCVGLIRIHDIYQAEKG